MKRLVYAFCFPALLFAACGDQHSSGEAARSDSAPSGQGNKDAGAVTGKVVADTLQYIGASGDLSLFINRRVDTVRIRWNPLSGQAGKGVFSCAWVEMPQRSGADSTINVMKTCVAVNLPPFINLDVKQADRRISYMFYANGGAIGYLNDGTVVGCPRCEPSAGNAEQMLKDPPMGTYQVMKDGSLLVNGEQIERPEIKAEWNEWMIFDTKEKWYAFINDIDDLSTARNQQYLLQFVNGYLRQLNRNEGTKADRNWVLSNVNLTDSFKYQYRKWLAENPQPEADPVLDAQDYPDGQLSIHSFNEEDRYFWLAAKEQKDPVLVARLKLEHDKWLVDGCGVINIPAGKRLHR